MTELRLRHGARAIVLDPDDRILLCRFPLRSGPGDVWATPGGGVERGESTLAALHRELVEELGLRLDDEPPHVWRERILGPQFALGYDGVLNDIFLVRTEAFTPRGSMTETELAAEGILELRWWTVAELAAHPGLLGPRDLVARLTTLVRTGVPGRPVHIGFE